MSYAAVRRRNRLLAAFAFVFFVVFLGLLISSLKKVPATEMGLQYNVHKKQLEDAIKSGGLFLGPPGYEFIKFPSTFITVDLRDRTCVSKDGLLVTFSVMFQYQMTASNVYPAILKYRNFEKWASVVEQAGLSSIHHSCAEFLVAEFQNQRGVIQSTMLDNLKAKLEENDTTDEEGVNAVAVSLQLTYVNLPEAYNEAVAKKQAAEEDIALAIAQRKQETTKARTEFLKAIEEAKKIEDTANNNAAVLLTETKLKVEAEKQAAEEDIALAIAQREQEITKANTEFLKAIEEAKKIEDTANNNAAVLLTETKLEVEAEKQAAEIDVTLAIAQREQEITKANTEFLRAKEEAKKIEDTANNDAEVLLVEAKFKAEETLYSFQKEAEALIEVKDKLNLTTEGVLAHLSNRLLSEASNLKVTAGEPARFSRKDEL